MLEEDYDLYMADILHEEKMIIEEIERRKESEK